jgi:hypothetical protein
VPVDLLGLGEILPPRHRFPDAAPLLAPCRPPVLLLGLSDLGLEGVDDPVLEGVCSGEAIGPGGLPEVGLADDPPEMDRDLHVDLPFRPSLD